MKRINSIDIVRGIVVMIMALDHIRDFMHVNPLNVSPTDLTTTSPSLFFTRWLTHLCAPTFVFLSGTSAFLITQRNPDFKTNKQKLLKRGSWLVILNFTLNNFAIYFDIRFGVLFSQVIAAIGFGLIGLSCLLKVKPKTLGIAGLLVIFLHDLFSGLSFSYAPLNFIWQLLMGVGVFPITPGHFFLVSYPIIPWLGIMLVGYSTGSWYNLTIRERRSLLLRTGSISLGLFVVLRAINLYGDPSKWSVQKNDLYTFLSFINTTKYPPSLLFTLMTLGFTYLLLAIFDQRKNRLTGVAVVYGRVSLFFWLLHWFLIHFIAAAVFLLQGYSWTDLQFTGFGFGRPKNGGGLGLTGIYLVWMSVVIIFYPLCIWYWNYKTKHREIKWLSYL